MSDQRQKPTGKRRYRKRRRAAGEAETRRRITEAAVELHGTVGPARTTVTAVADRAGVQRGTVYRHFPDAESLFAACSEHWRRLNPPPDPGAWALIEDPDERLRAGLAELYEWYRWAQPMLDQTTRDAPLVPAMSAAAGAVASHFTALREALTAGRRERGARRRRSEAAIAHAIAFPTWRSLVHEGGLEVAEAVELMASLVAAAADGGAARAA